MAIYTSEDGCCSISSRQVAIPGVYENEKCARYAFQFSDSVLQQLMNEANDRCGGSGGTITQKDLKLAKKRMIDKYTLGPLT
jgi:hypothetical protein